jgi:hypothetical protein
MHELTRHRTQPRGKAVRYTGGRLPPPQRRGRPRPQWSTTPYSPPGLPFFSRCLLMPTAHIRLRMMSTKGNQPPGGSRVSSAPPCVPVISSPLSVCGPSSPAMPAGRHAHPVSVARARCELHSCEAAGGGGGGRDPGARPPPAAGVASASRECACRADAAGTHRRPGTPPPRATAAAAAAAPSSRGADWAGSARCCVGQPNPGPSISP